MDTQVPKLEAYSPNLVAINNALIQYQKPLALEQLQGKFSIASTGIAVKLALLVSVGNGQCTVSLCNVFLQEILKPWVSIDEWYELPKPLQLGVLTLASTGFLEKLEHSLQAPVAFKEIIYDTSADHGPQLLFQGTYNGFSASATIELLNVVLKPLLSSLEKAPPQKRNDYASIPVPLEVNLASTELSFSDFRSLEVNDIIFFDQCTCASNPNQVYIKGPSSWGFNAEFTADHTLTVTGLIKNGSPDHINTRSDSMELDNIPVELTFNCGSLTLALQELQTLQEGQIMELTNGDISKVTMLANNHAIGFCELVKVGDKLGAKVLQLNTPTPPPGPTSENHTEEAHG